MFSIRLFVLAITLNFPERLPAPFSRRRMKNELAVGQVYSTGLILPDYPVRKMLLIASCNCPNPRGANFEHG